MTSNYMVMAVTLLIWVALFVYLLMLDRKVKKLED
ncbi:MAG: CcmD family protein [candidate division Zixibacteria bacterium]